MTGNPTLEYLLKDCENTNWKRYIHTCVHCSAGHNRTRKGNKPST